MRDHESRSTAHKLFQRIDDALFGIHVHGAGRLVQNQHGRIFQKRARNRQALTLTPGEARVRLRQSGVS